MGNPVSPDFRPKSFWQYQRLVWLRAAYKTWDKLGVPGAIFGFAASFISDLIIRSEQSRTDVNVGDVVTTAAIFLGLCITALVLYVFREPVVIYNEQVEEINKRDNTLELAQDVEKASRRSELLKQIERDGVDESDKLKWSAEIETLNPILDERVRVAAVLFRIWIDKSNRINVIAEVMRESYKESIYPILESAIRLDPDFSRYKQIEKTVYPNKVKK